MGAIEDPFLPVVAGDAADEYSLLSRRPIGNASPVSVAAAAVTTARFAGFDLQDQPLVTDLACLPGQVVTARTTVVLRREMIGRPCVIVFENGDVQRPILLGVMQDPQRQSTATSPARVPSAAHPEPKGSRASGRRPPPASGTRRPSSPVASRSSP